MTEPVAESEFLDARPETGKHKKQRPPTGPLERTPPHRVSA